MAGKYEPFNRKVFSNGKKGKMFDSMEMLALLCVAIIHELIEMWYASIKFSAPKNWLNFHKP